MPRRPGALPHPDAVERLRWLRLQRARAALATARPGHTPWEVRAYVARYGNATFEPESGRGQATPPLRLLASRAVRG